ncbi:hypothetical protein N7523_004053 [Penicillium sp. IBT 18751x]|nr:hypothetical protein N7523_004053 [Penicillium sp. IBT 18751x]
MQSKDLSRYGQILLGQGLIEQVFIDHLRHGRRIEIERSKAAIALDILPSVNGQTPDFPIAVKAGTRTNQTGFDTSPVNAENSPIHDETICARYLVGCDGAHSWTREQLGVPSEATSSGSTWGVIDFEPITDFRKLAVFCLEEPYITQRYSKYPQIVYGSIMTVPRERKLVRLYIELHERADTETVRKSSRYSLEGLFQIAEKIIKPYKLSSNYCDWWSIYPASKAALSLHSGS